MDWQRKNIEVYNRSAKKFSNFFSSTSPRVADIEVALDLSDNPDHAKVVEIGCGDGRDAAEIIKRVKWYEGFDPSVGLISIAKRRLPGASFKLADAVSYNYPGGLDVVYAFASLLHVDRSTLKTVLKKVTKSLNPGGILYISLKYSESYNCSIKTDENGERLFYMYNPEIIRSLASPKLESVYEDRQQLGKTTWFSIALKKV